MKDFDPNDLPPPPDHRWGSYRPGHTKNRQPWKTHATLRHVRAAIDQASTIVVYERVSGVWVERYRHDYQHPRPVPPPECHVCGKDGDWTWLCWSPDADFEKVMCHHRCRRGLGVRQEAG